MDHLRVDMPQIDESRRFLRLASGKRGQRLTQERRRELENLEPAHKDPFMVRFNPFQG